MTGAVMRRMALGPTNFYQPSPTPNWANINRAGFAQGANADQSIAGIPAGQITVTILFSGSQYSIFNAVRTAPSAGSVDLKSTPQMTMTNGESWHFDATYNGVDPVNETITVRNDSDAGSTLDTFTMRLA